MAKTMDRHQIVLFLGMSDRRHGGRRLTDLRSTESGAVRDIYADERPAIHQYEHHVR